MEKRPEREGTRRYWAFISYSQRDAAAAKKLHEFLETYRIPRGLIGRPMGDRVIPARLVPVFRDRDELPGSSDLDARLKESLAASDSLVVICSPNGGSSRWVNEEVRSYKSMGHASRVFPFVIPAEGERSSDVDLSEYFPPALRFEVTPDGVITDRHSEPLAADARPDKDGWKDACLKVVAGIIGVGFDELRRRELHRRRRQRIVKLAMAVAAVLMLSFTYVALADDEVALPGGEAVRRSLDRRGWTLFRPVMSRDEMKRSATSIRTALRKRLLAGVASGEIEKEGQRVCCNRTAQDKPLPAWLIGQVVGAAFRDPDTQPDDLRKLAIYYDRLFNQGTETDVDRAKLLSAFDDVGNVGRAEPVVWTVIGLSTTLRRRAVLGVTQATRFEEYLAAAQRLAEAYNPLGDGGWNTSTKQVRPDDHFIYTTALALHMLLEVRAANAGWRGSRKRLDDLIAQTTSWLVAAFDSGASTPGWRRSLNDDKEPDAGITLLAYSALGRVCAGSNAKVPPAIVQAALRSQEELRRRSYESADPDIRFDVAVADEKRQSTEVTITRMIWYPWAIDGLVNWRTCAEKTNLGAQTTRVLDRSVSHLLGVVSHDVLRDVTRRQKPLFVTAETYYGLGDVR